MDRLSFMVECLKEFNYPNLQAMDDSETTGIFSSDNRQFLVSWLLKQTNEGFTEIVDRGNTEDIADILVSCGFCTPSQKNSFMSGTSEHSEQILQRMFKHLKDVRTPVKLDKNRSFGNSDQILKFDKNLFPMYGPKPAPEHLNELQKEFEKIKSGLNTQIQSAKIDPDLINKLTDSFHGILQNFYTFESDAAETINKLKNVQQPDPNLFGDDFEQILEECKEQIGAIHKFLKNLITILSFKEDKPESPLFDNSKHEMLKKITSLCQEIAILNGSKDSSVPVLTVTLHP